MQILSKIAIFYKKIDRFSHLLVGMPSYDKYVEYMQKFHPNETPQTQREFFKEALEKKYGAGSSKCFDFIFIIIDIIFKLFDISF